MNTATKYWIRPWMSLIAFLAFVVHAQAMPPADGIEPPTVVARDANSRSWGRITPISTNRQGQITYRTNITLTQMAAGLHYRSNGAWAESSSAIAITQAGAAATNSLQKAWFPANANTAGGIRLVTPENQELRSHIIGLSYSTATTNVLIGLLQDSTGTLISTNQVLYTNAFAGAFKADVRYTFTGPGSVFEQDVLIRTQLPSPTNWGLTGPITLQCWTEYVGAPQPTVSERRGSPDQRIAFGGTIYGPGRAFFVGDEQNTTPVRKHWVVNPENGRTCLLEEIDLSAIAGRLQDLPPYAGGGSQGGGQALLYPGFPKQLPPAPKLAQHNGETIKVAVAQRDASPAFVIDYVTLSTAQTNYTFQADTTYYITTTFGLAGTTTFEGGTVLKYTDAYGSWGLDILGALVCKTGPYRPAIFTTFNDDSVGEINPHQTSPPTTSDYIYFLNLDSSSIDSLSYCRFSYGQIGVILTDSSASIDISNCQFVNCAFGIETLAPNDLNLHNVLFASPGGYALEFDQVGSFNFTAEQVTADCSSFWGMSSYEPAFYLANSIIVGSFTTPSSLSTTSVAINPGGSLFQTVGAGQYYLADGSSYRNAGTSSLSAAMLAQLPYKTTSPPIIISNDYVTDVTFSPQAPRETGVPSLGYLYDPLDYIVTTTFSNATCLLTNGVALAYHEYGIWLKDDAHLVSRGMADHRNYLVHYATVQEQSTNVSGFTYPILYASPTPIQYANAGHYPGLDLQFLTFSVPSGSTAVFYTDSGAYTVSNLDMRHCEMFCNGGYFNLGDTNTNATINFQNNLFFRPYMFQMLSRGQLTAYNNLFVGTINNSMWFINDGSHTWTERDNAFDGGDTFVDGNIGHNAYLNGASNGAGAQTGDVTANLTWVSGSLGDFYHSSGGGGPLVNAGSRTAANAGLYHYTVRTDQTKDSSTVDIGYHYVALDGYGKPVDTDSDGVPDYRENPSGGGTVVSGETDWQSATDLGLKVFITRPRDNSILP